MLAARIIKSAPSHCGLPVVIAKQKSRTSRFCADYQALNERIKAGKFPLSKIEELIHDMGCSKSVRKLDVFGGYCKLI